MTRPPAPLEISRELRKLALDPENALQPAALIHEAYIQLIDPADRTIDGRSRFFGAAAHLVREILVELAGSGNESRVLTDRQRESFIASDQALNKLAGESRRKAKVLELRLFGGLQPDQIAVALGISIPGVKRDLLKGELWMRGQ